MELPDDTTPIREDALSKIGDLAAEAGIRRVHILTWRDLHDVEAGGSEVHVDQVASQWASAGIDVVMRSSFAAGHSERSTRNGYLAIRRAGRYLVFPRAVAAELLRRHGPRDALVEVWNGMPFFTPLWAGGPRLVVLHHVHQEMWRLHLPPALASIGDLVERRLAPPLYRRSRIVTLSTSSREEIVEQMGLPRENITVVPAGLDPSFTPSTEARRSDVPLVVAVGRLVPIKRFDLLIRAASVARQSVPNLRLTIVGEGFSRERLEAVIEELGAHEWVDLPGRVADDALLATYRAAWVVASMSAREGWGMSLTEAAGVGTPAVATRITGHVDAVIDGVTGLLVEPGAMAEALVRVLADHGLRTRLGQAAETRARELSWSSTALSMMRVLADDSKAKRR
jgi:glycosyltransferase involved in cell wall biosynthesis